MGGSPGPGRPWALAAADQPQAPPAFRHALATTDLHLDHYIAQARLKPAS